MEQRSKEWFAARLGKVTCSRLGCVMASGRGSKESATRRNYMSELICERLTGQRQEIPANSAMQWGTETEPLARMEYEMRMGATITEDGGKECTEIPGFWGSPDGLIGTDGGIEIKCPNTATHLDNLLTGKIKRDYIYQMTGNLIIYNRQWWDFVSYDPRLPEDLRFCRYRYTRADLPCDELIDGVSLFLKELNDKLEKLKSYKEKV
jgi:hypothetical protein